MSDVDIVLEIATKGVDDIYKLSNAMQQLDKVLRGVANPMKALDARSRALSAAVGSADSSLKSHARTIGQLSRNNSVLSNELGRVRKEISSMGTDFRYASGASSSFRKTAISDLKAYENSLKKIRMGALAEDLRGVAQEQKRLGKDAQFVGRSLIIGLTTPIVAFGRYGLQALVGVDREFVRLNKVLENVSPNIEAAAKKMNIDLTGATKEQSKQLQGMVDRYDRLDKSLTKVSNKFGLAKSITVGLAGDFAELGIQSEESIAKITELTAATEKLGDMDIGAAKDLVQSLYFQAQRAMQMSGQGRNMTFQEREIAAIGAATSQLNLFNSVENVTALTLRDLGDAFPEVAAAGSSFGLSMTELAGMLAPMKAAGFEVGASANSIKVSLQRLVAPTKQNSDLFKQLTAQYGVNFTAIKGTGLDAIQSLIDGFNQLKGSTAGQEGAMEFFAKVFGVRQGPRMEVAIAQMAEFDLVLKNSTSNLDSAEKKLQGFANEAIKTANASSNANLPVIQSYKDIGIIARIATAQVKEGETAEVDGFGKVTLEQVKEARKVRKAVTAEIVKAQRTDGTDLIGQVNTEAGRAMFIELAGAANAAEIAQRELDVALGSLDTQLSILKNNFKSFAADVIKGVRPALEKIADISSKLATAWGNLDGKTKKLISTIVVGFASVTAAIGPLIFVFGQFRLAMSSIAGVLFSFLPSLKTMTVDAVAGSEGLLRLTKPLEVMGDTVVNTNGKFATFIATLASGEGPVGKLANKIGLMTGTLQKTTTAPVGLTREVLATTKKARETLPPLAGGTGPVSMGPLGTPVGTPAASLSARLKSALKLQGSGIMSGAAGVRLPTGRMGPMSPDDKDMLTKVEALMKKNLVDRGYPTVPGGRGPGGAFSRTVDDMVQDAIRLQAAGTTSGSAGIRTASGRFRRITSGERESLRNFEDTRETLVKRSVAQRALSRKDIDFDIFSDQRSYKGRDISSERASDIYRGGIKGRIAKIAEATSRGKEAGPDNIRELGGKVKGLATAPVTAFKKSIEGASVSVMALRAQHAAAGAEAPRFFLRMKTAMIGFTNATSFGTKAMKLLKLAMISSGIGAILLILAVGFILIKNNMDKFKEAGAKGLKVVGEAFKIVKNAVMEIIRPVVDLFSHFGSGSEGSAGAVEGIGNAFNKLAGVLKWVAGMFAKLVEVYIKPYMYMIVNIVAAVVSLFQGKWKKAFSFLIAAVAFAVEIFINLFAIAFKIIVSLAGGLVKGVISVFGLLGKGVIELIVLPTTLILKALTSLPLGIGDKFKGVNNAFRGVVNSAKGMVDTATGAVNGVVDKAVSGTNGLIDKAAGGLKGKLKGLKKGGIAESKGKITIGKGDVDTDPMEEQIANATGDGIKAGATEGAKALAKKLAGYAKSLKQELQTDIQDRIKGVMADVITSLTEGLKTQKESSLKLFDDQLEKIDSVAKAEERLTKTKEYENKKREMEEKRALSQLNSQRNYQLAIYEGRIDDAREISLEGRKSELDAAKESGELEISRNKELADQAKEDLVDSIKKAKEVATKYFDDAIKSFGDAAKKITEFPPTTAEKFNEQLEKLKTAAGDKSKLMGTAFTSSFTGALAALGVDAEGPLTTSLAAIAETISKNNPFGATGVWQTTIDASLEGLKQKYIGLTDTLNTAVGESSGKFSELFAIYTKYKDLVAAAEGDTAGGSAGGGKGGGKGTGNGNAGKPGFNKDGVKIGNKVAIATANANLSAIKTYSDKYLEEKYGKTSEGKKLAASIKGTVGAIASSSVLLGGHDNGMKDFMPIITASKYKDQITTNSELIYAYIMNNRAQFIKGGGPLGRTDESGRSGFFKGGMLSYGDGGKTEGPVQQGINATLHGGEYVVRNSAVKKYGWGMLQNINQGTYKPKPFENGGMIESFAKGGKVRKSIVPAPRRIPTESPIDTTDPSYKEWQWQQQSGGLNYEFLYAIAKKESAEEKLTKGLPNWTDIGGMRKPDNKYTPNDKSSGGFNMPLSLWRALGGDKFGAKPGDATSLQQMVINNRHLVFGWFNPKAQLYNTPRGTDKHTIPRYERGAAKTSYVPTPESFDPTKSYQENLVTNETRGKRKASANLPMGFATVAGKNRFLAYFERAQDIEGTQRIARIQNPFGTPFWIRPKKGEIVNSYVKASNAKIVPTPAGFEYGGVIPQYKIGGLVRDGAGKDNNIPKYIGPDQDLSNQYPSIYNLVPWRAPVSPYKADKAGDTENAYRNLSFRGPLTNHMSFIDDIFNNRYETARIMIHGGTTTPPLVIDRTESQNFRIDSYRKRPFSPENLVDKITKTDTVGVLSRKDIRDYFIKTLKLVYPKAYDSAKFTMDYLDNTSIPMAGIPDSPSTAFHVMPVTQDIANDTYRQKIQLLKNAGYFQNNGKFKKLNVGLSQPKFTTYERLKDYAFDNNKSGKFYDRKPSLTKIFEELQRFITIPYQIFYGNLSLSRKELLKRKELALNIGPMGTKGFPNYKNTGGYASGFVDLTGRIAYHPDYKAPVFEDVMRHELGHILGMMHTMPEADNGQESNLFRSSFFNIPNHAKESVMSYEGNYDNFNIKAGDAAYYQFLDKAIKSKIAPAPKFAWDRNQKKKKVKKFEGGMIPEYKIGGLVGGAGNVKKPLSFEDQRIAFIAQEKMKEKKQNIFGKIKSAVASPFVGIKNFAANQLLNNIYGAQTGKGVTGSAMLLDRATNPNIDTVSPGISALNMASVRGALTTAKQLTEAGAPIGGSFFGLQKAFDPKRGLGDRLSSGASAGLSLIGPSTIFAANSGYASGLDSASKAKSLLKNSKLSGVLNKLSNAKNTMQENFRDFKQSNLTPFFPKSVYQKWPFYEGTDFNLKIGDVFLPEISARLGRQQLENNFLIEQQYLSYGPRRAGSSRRPVGQWRDPQRPPASPSQLPPMPAGFTGRDADGFDIQIEKPFRNIFEEAGANKFFRQSEGATKDVFPTLPRILSRRLTAGIPMRDWLETMSEFKGIERLNEQKDVAKIINSLQRKKPGYVEGYKIPTNTKESMALAQQRLANKIKNFIVPKSTVESIGTTMGPNPLKVAQEEMARALKKAQAQALREKVLANLEEFRKGRKPAEYAKQQYLAQAQGLGLKPEDLDSLINHPDFVTIMKTMSPKSIRTAVNKKMGIVDDGLAGRDSEGNGAYELSVWRPDQKSPFAREGSSIGASSEFMFTIYPILDAFGQLARDPSGQIKKHLQIASMYTAGGTTGRYDMMQLLAYVFDEIVVKQNIATIANSSYSIHSLALSHTFGEIIKELRPRTQIITPAISRGMLLNDSDFVDELWRGEQKLRPETFDDFFSGTGTGVPTFSPNARMTNLAPTAGQRVRMQHLVEAFGKAKRKIRNAGIELPNAESVRRKVRGAQTNPSPNSPITYTPTIPNIPNPSLQIGPFSIPLDEVGGPNVDFNPPSFDYDIELYNGGSIPYSKGGPTYGPVQQGIPATLHGGEYVVRNSAVKKYGQGMLQSINQGTYKPKPFENGGMIPEYKIGGVVKGGAGKKLIDRSKLNPFSDVNYKPKNEPVKQKKGILDKIQGGVNSAMNFAADFIDYSGKQIKGMTYDPLKRTQEATFNPLLQLLKVPGSKNLPIATPKQAALSGFETGLAAFGGPAMQSVISKIAGIGLKGGLGPLDRLGASIANKITNKSTVNTNKLMYPDALDMVFNPSTKAFELPTGLRPKVKPTLKKPMTDLELFRKPIVPERVEFLNTTTTDYMDVIQNQIKSALVYDINGSKVAFGVDKHFKSANPFVKAIARNPYTITGTSPTGPNAVQIANDYIHAVYANMQAKGPLTQADALLYAMTKGDINAAVQYNALVAKGRVLRPKQSTSEEYMSEIAEKHPYMITGMERMGLDKFDPKNLFLVHETAHKPKFDKFGNLIIKPVSEYQTNFPNVSSIKEFVKYRMESFGNRDLDPIQYALQQKEETANIIEYSKAEGASIVGDSIVRPSRDYYRDTIHFALNHLVQGHGQRESLTEGYVIVANLMETLKANPGALSSLYSVDSWLTPKAGEGLKFPVGSFDILPVGPSAAQDVYNNIFDKVYPKDILGFSTYKSGDVYPIIPGGTHGTSSIEWVAYIRNLSKKLGVQSSPHFESASQKVADLMNYELGNQMPPYWEHLSPNEIARLFYKRNIFTGIQNKVTTLGGLPDFYKGGLIKGFANGGAVPGFGSQGMPALLHGGEYVVNSSAVKNIGFAALQAMNDMRFNTPKAPAYSGPVQPQQNSTSSVNIYVDNFIGEKQWFESMMKDYNINVSPQNQKNAGLQNRTISTYNGLNRGL